MVAFLDLDIRETVSDLNHKKLLKTSLVSNK